VENLRFGRISICEESGNVGGKLDSGGLGLDSDAGYLIFVWRKSCCFDVESEAEVRWLWERGRKDWGKTGLVFRKPYSFHVGKYR
jgi:hypothetical protein